MARTTKDGTVFLTGYDLEEDVQTGTVAKDDDSWRSDCALDEEFFLARTKAEAVRQLDEHFVKNHTTLQ